MRMIFIKIHFCNKPKEKLSERYFIFLIICTKKLIHNLKLIRSFLQINRTKHNPYSVNQIVDQYYNLNNHFFKRKFELCIFNFFFFWGEGVD